MNRLPTKQIYLLAIIVFGIITLSVYSTYAIFTLESESSDIVSIKTPNSLEISSDVLEYRQVAVPKDSYITTDVDLYNTFDYELCYSIWYKVLGEEKNVKLYEITDDTLTVSSTIEPASSKRISLLITNDNNQPVKIKFGLTYIKNEGTCQLKISEDKSLIANTINNPKLLTDTLINNTEIINNEAGYLTYKDNSNIIPLAKDETIYISDKFTYRDELFTLTAPIEITSKDIENYNNGSFYTCLNSGSCNELINIKELSSDNEEYHIIKYNLLIGYLAGSNGLRRLTNNNYSYYGDNPNNFIYQNCTNELDNKTCELWRIIGFVYDQKEEKYLTKLVNTSYLKKTKYSEESQKWSDSLINKYFKEEYRLNNNYMAEYSYKQENLLNLKSKIGNINYLPDEIVDKVSILSLSDYLNASICENRNIEEYDSACLKNNWLNKNNSEWTMTTKYEEPYNDSETEELITPENNTIYTVGNEIKDETIDNEFNVRPVIYLKSRMLLVSGDGTLDNPYIIK